MEYFEHIRKVEDKIKDLLNTVLKDGQIFRGKWSCTDNLAEIPEIPIQDYQELLEQIRQGKAIVRMAPMSISSEIFELLATKFESILLTATNLSVFVLPIAGIVLGFFISWWYVLLGVVSGFFSMRLGKRIYLRTLFRSAFSSEVIFSFLFTGNKITLELPGYGILYRS